MSIARHHNEWLSLIETSGPFLSMPVLMRVFPQGLDPRDPSKAKELSIAYEEWRQNPGAPGHHRAWVEFVLTRILEFPKELMAEGQSLPPGLEAIMEIYGETLRPDIAIIGPSDTPAAGKSQSLIQIFPHTQNLGSPIPGRLWKDSPATRMVELLHGTGVLLGLVTNGEQWMLVHAPPGETTGFATWRADIWQEEHITLRAFHSLLHCRRFFGVAESDTLASLLKESAQDQQEVTDQLGYQVRRAVEVLVQAFDLLDQESGRKLLAGLDEKTIYDAALTLMMRLIFLFCAEEQGLLRLGEPLYDDFYAVSTLRERLRGTADQQGEEILERRSDAWARLLATFRAVHGGVEHESMRLIAYGGTLFDPDRYPFLEGRLPGTNWRETAAAPPVINNRVVLHLLESLQVLRVKVPGGGPAEARRISFRGLDIEQIGHVYEGLLDHTAVRAQAIFLGLKGTRIAEPEILLETLEKLHATDENKFIEFLREETGRSELALHRDLSFETTPGKRQKINVHSVISSSSFSDHILLIACRNNPGLLDRIRPFARLIRSDDFDRPVLIHPGSIFVTKGSERRSTGTHYTPRSLTEPIIQHALEQLVYIGPAEGNPKDQWKLRSPREILELKVCDMAMGSGAFLVQACRYLAERLAEAWEELEKANPDKILATPEGNLSSGHPSERLIPIDPDERLAIARRYVADRCLYGVDINPMAVEMAKLSLWLITLQRDRPFSFLDHSFKCGDSLLGLSLLKQIEYFSLRPGERQITFATASLLSYLEEASAKRRELEALPSNDHAQIEAKNRLYVKAEADITKVKALADCLIAFELSSIGGKDYEEKRTIAAERAEASMRKPLSAFLAYAREQLQGRRTFHWPLEFPEVFVNQGFDAFVGNPPFRGGLMITRDFDLTYTLYLKAITSHAGATSDLCAYFFRRAFALLRFGGHFGLLATNSICEGDTRNTSLEPIVESKGSIIRAVRSMPWPGTAALHVSVVHVTRGPWKGARFLDNLPVNYINSGLNSESRNLRPLKLMAIIPAFLGTTVYGRGFFLSEREAHSLIQQDASCKKIIQPFLNGEDVLASSSPQPSRFVLNFQGLSHQEIQQFGPAYAIAKERIFPERQRSSSKRRREMWWLYTSPAEDLYENIKELGFVFVTCFTSKHVVFVKMGIDMVFSNAVIAVALDDYAIFAVLQSSLHDIWVREHSSTLETRQRYALSDCYETFPAARFNKGLRDLGELYHSQRSELMIKNDIGLTTTYNRFHDPKEKSGEIERLRILHTEIDQKVAVAYGWSDLDLGHGFHETKQGIRFTLSESARRIVLERLLTLNHQRHEEELKAGLHEEKAKSLKRSSGKKSGRDIVGQARLLPDK